MHRASAAEPAASCSRVRAVALAAVAFGLAGCAQDVERGPAERRNHQALSTVPALSGTEIIKTETRGYTQPDTSDDRIIGWATYRAFRVPEPQTFQGMSARVEAALDAAGWQVTEQMGGRYLKARRGGSCLTAMPVSNTPPADAQIPDPSVTVKPTPSEAARALIFVVTVC